MSKVKEYIKEAVAEAKKELAGSNIPDCNITVQPIAAEVSQTLTEALLMQAEANSLNSKAMLEVANTLKSTDVCGIKIINNKI